MSIEPIGIATFLIGLFCLALGNGALVPAVAMASLFGASAALLIGAANIQPGHVVLGFLLISVMSRGQDARNMIRALRPGEPGFWFACLTLYGVASAFLLPRVLAGSTQIVPLGSSVYDETGSTIPLVPVSSNLTQSVYLTANLIVFAAVAGIAARREGFVAVLAGLMAYCIGNTLFALIDLATYATGTQDLLGFMRNARYTLHTDTEIAGLKRIVGSFTEASAFARSTLGVIGFTGTLWLCGYRPALTGGVTAASLVLLVLSTSSTGLAGSPVILALLYGTALFGGSTVFGGRTRSFAIVLAPPLLLGAALFVVLDEGTRTTVRDYVDMLLLQKGNSDSGIERSSWNRISFQNFLDTGGLGVGLGTARASSFVVALLATVGIPGALFYALFFTSALLQRRGVPGSFPSCVRLAARNGCFGLMIGDLLVGPVIDQGLFFCLLAAIASAYPERDEALLRQPLPRVMPLGVRA
ncbi:hypothetical protein [Bosea sp. BH3]|uniref:hypothetical protein n=1 Tax=Bosea sp. BH3 TaxID=2871701 RepID=UPI0021CB7DA2|nr:hypothetical protein [Bosea sp. BH3]MCU4181113.1 hypothetical protein [Bosea sp. BH3]